MWLSPTANGVARASVESVTGPAFSHDDPYLSSVVNR